MYKLSKNHVVFILIAFALISAGVIANSLNKAEKSEASSDNIVQSSNTLEEKAVKVSDEEPKEKLPEIVSYVVKSGDTLESIASSYGIKVSSITESNNISNDAVLKEGQQLRFPSIDGILYKVKSGETLWEISRAYDIDLNELQRINSINSSDKLKLDQEIIIPGADKIKVIKANKPAAKDSVTASKIKSIKTASRGGSLVSPLPGIIWPLRGKITSGFGPRDGRMHNGLDIAAPTGTNIKAALDGKVIFSGWKNGYGNIVILNNGNGVETYYAHNSSNLVKVGQDVSKGQVIAKVGSNGNATGSVLHFEVRKGGKPYNPLIFLP
ncbi:peptidoglycan DD-metalloendopeptidase family protein [Fonticella tunisiensis]|uniref:Murein DD-endopeptidase MepM/ murein hydrolase activator NlpD n=1 Tax=Fonticella tunisiensis TaxID=1096341 RepID=A0A4R7KVS3_9CLOT|nr:peptidoglycan DD-metalloendopeptidase family protein [Fonticella tunisiensis]TDT63641.1 murein DD-endopeptidase MepM/ murein hydrolase activator NlpD [Fonticella tunisiensis]